MKRLLPLLLLAGCATSASVYEKPAALTVASHKSPRSFALCVVEHIAGGSMYSLRNDGEHYWIVGQFGAASAIIRWDFLPRPNGESVAELRSTFHVGGSNTGTVRTCSRD